MKKKALSLLLSTAMVLSLAACGSNESTPVATDSASSTEAAAETAETTSYDLQKIKMVVNGTLTATEDNGQADFKKQWEEAVGIELDIQQLDHSGYADAVGRLFAGGDMPDVMIMSADMYAQYAQTGLLWDMTEAYNNAEFQNRMVAPEINENLKIDGKLYGFAPAYGNGCVTYVKKAWLDAVGIDASSVKTYDDYYNMLLAFHNGDPDGNGVEGDTYGVIAAGYLGNEAPYINYLPEFWQDAYPAILQDENGVWYDGFQTEETKAALLRLQQAAADGAIDPETFTASTKIAREKWFSNEQSGSAGAFTYWAGTWYQNLTDSLTKNDVDSELVMLEPIAEVGAYINREAPVWVIIDDMDGDNAREQAIFDKFIDTMLDGDTVQMLWTYGAKGVHWDDCAEEFTIYPGDAEKEKTYSYEAGQFHLKPSPNDANSVWKKNAMDPALVVCKLANDDYNSVSDLAAKGNALFTANCVDAPKSPASETYTNEAGNIYDAKMAVISAVVVDGGDVDAAMDTYLSTVGATVEQILAELNQ